MMVIVGVEALKKRTGNKIGLPVQPPAEIYAKEISHERMNRAVEILGGIPINFWIRKASTAKSRMITKFIVEYQTKR